jgi:hypothetical protein
MLASIQGFHFFKKMSNFDYKILSLYDCYAKKRAKRLKIDKIELTIQLYLKS